MAFNTVPVSATDITSGTMSGTYSMAGTMASPNYAAGVAGWVVKGDGSAEFNSVTARGEVDVNGPGGQYVKIYNDATNGAIVAMEPATSPAATTPARLITEWLDVGNGPQPFMVATAPNYNSHGYAELDLSGTNAGGASGTRAELKADNTFLTGTQLVQAGVGSTYLSVNPGAVHVTGNLTASGTLTGSSIAGSVSVSFTSQTSFTMNVTFPVTFATVPAVMVNIASGSGVTAHWHARANGPTTTSFQLFLFAESGIAAQTWAAIPVQWIAIGT